MPVSATLILVALGHLGIPGSGVEFSTDRAITFATLAGAAYCLDNSDDWSCGYKCIPSVTSVNVCRGDSTNAYVGKFEGGCIVGFEGTGPQHNLYSVITDLISLGTVPWDVCGDQCVVGQGFLDEWNSLRNCTKQALRANDCNENSTSEVRTTGHSLGAATSNLAMMELKKAGWNVMESYNFGAPRVGNGTWAARFNEMFKNQSFRVTHAQDPIPTSILDIQTDGIFTYFEHTEPEMYYKGLNSEGYVRCDLPHTHECIEQYYIPEWYHILDHLDYMEVFTGHHDCGVQGTTGVLLV